VRKKSSGVQSELTYPGCIVTSTHPHCFCSNVFDPP